ncbi:MAG: hypothetical protein HY650_05220 [Acidobacteria bacterium]|nr:hypothetical protein [Acidobacteriota bacterium]
MTIPIDPASVKIISMRQGGANAINREFFRVLSGHLADAENADITAVELTGNERLFSAGLDLITLYEYSRDQTEEEMREFTGGAIASAPGKH